MITREPQGRKYILAGLAAVAAFLAGADEGYQYIVSGYPVANPCHSLASTGRSLATGRHTRSVDSALEARYRTFLASEGGRLLSTKFISCRLVVR